MRKYLFSTFTILALVFPLSVQALSIGDLKPQVDTSTITAKSVVVLNQVTGELLYEQGGADARVPASLVKLTTVLVALDLPLNWNARCTVGEQDRVGGVSITKAGERKTYTLNALLYATLLPSANDAATALARCSGLSRADYLARMQAKVAAQGAVATTFADFSGMSGQNKTTAVDLAKIANAAFSTEKVRTITRTQSYRLCPVGAACQTIRTTNQLLQDKELTTIAGKTGTLDGAINFAGSFRDPKGRYFIVVVLGGSTKESRFAEAKQLVQFATVRQDWSDLFASR